MNDRVSAAPPPDFLDEGTSTADYEKQFAMDWKPPELKFGTGDGAGAGGADNGHSNVPGNRNSFMSVNSGLSAFTTRTGAGAAASTKTPRSLFGKVREKLAMQKSRSSWTVGGAADDADDNNNNNDTDKNSSWANFPIPPVFKHKRSESMDPSTLRTNNRSSGINTQPTTEFGKFQQDATARAGGGRPAPPVRADSLMASLPSFDPTKRPTRDEITANYQSLLASGFFGTHAIQSTRFSPPGANIKRRSEASPEEPSLAQKMEEETEEGSSQFPPSPERQPPPLPPPNREPPPPPSPEMAMDVEEEEPASSTRTAIPASSTAVFSPLPLSRTSSRERDTTMSPPPLPKQRPQKKPALAFASVPYSATRPGAEPTLTARPYRPPPVSLARFSVDSSRPRSIDVQSFARGTKRPFSSGTNSSQASFYTPRSSYDYDPMATDGHGGIGVATTTAEEKVESGPRKLVKRLRKSASKLSFRSNNSSVKFGGGQGNNEAEDGGELQQPPTRTSMSSTVRRSFSWRLGASKPETSSAAASSNNIFGAFRSAGGSDNSSLDNSTNTSMDSFQPPPPAPTIPPPSPPRGLPTIAASPSSADRNRLKKREIRARRLRRKEENQSPTKASSQQPTQDAMDWQHPPSPSKRPRRSDASIFLRALNSNPVTAVEEDSGSEPEMPMPVVVAAQEQPTPSTQQQQQQRFLPPAEGMEGVEFSFHFPGRTRPTSTPANGLHLGGPLAVVPDVNRGVMPSMGSAFQGFGAKKSGSVRVVRGDLV